MQKRFVLILALSSVKPASAFAHAFWLEPSSFVSSEGAVIALSLKVGENFSGEELVRHPSHLKTFELTQPKTTDAIEVPGRVGHRPAGHLRIVGEKPYIITYTSHFTETELTPDVFKQYVESEGLAAQVGASALATSAPVKEVYARNAKTLLVPPQHKNSAIDRVTGMPLELVCLEDSLVLWAGNGAGTAFRFRLLAEKKPLAGFHVFLESKRSGKVTASAITDKDGVVTFEIGEPGVYLVRAILIEQMPTVGQGWRSQWTSLSFSPELAKK